MAAGAQRRAVRVPYRQAATLTGRPPTGSRVGQGGAAGGRRPDRAVLHVCRSTRLPDPTDPDWVLFPPVHATGGIGRKPKTGHAVNEMNRRRAAAAGFTRAQTRLLGGHSLRSGFVTEAFRQGADTSAIMRQTGQRLQLPRQMLHDLRSAPRTVLASGRTPILVILPLPGPGTRAGARRVQRSFGTCP